MSWFNKKAPEHKVVKKSSKILGYGGDNAAFVPKKKNALGCYRTMKKPGRDDIIFALPGAETDPFPAEFDTEDEAWKEIKNGRLI